MKWFIIYDLFSNLSILDEEEIKDILGEYYVGINSHRRAPAGGAIAPRPGWRHFTIMSHRLQKWLYIATCWHYLFHWPDFARDSLILEFLNFCIFNKYWPMNFVAKNVAILWSSWIRNEPVWTGSKSKSFRKRMIGRG